MIRHRKHYHITRFSFAMESSFREFHTNTTLEFQNSSRHNCKHGPLLYSQTLGHNIVDTRMKGRILCYYTTYLYTILSS